MGTRNIKRIIGFAAPEIEAWVIADWDQTIAQDPDFRGCSQAIRRWMSISKDIPFNTPEAFSEYDQNKDACAEKLSNILIEATDRYCGRSTYSKAIHTPRFLEKLSAYVVSNKCPLFREMHNQLNRET